MVNIAGKKSAREKLSDVHPDYHFKTKDGSTVKSLHELEAVLKKMDDETFMHHVTDEKNDFQNWIQHIINDKSLAARLAKLSTKSDIIKAVEVRITQLERARDVEDMLNSAKDRIKRGIKARPKQDSDTPAPPKKGKPTEKSPAREHLIHNLKDFTEGVIIGVIIGIIIGKAMIG